MVSVEAFSNLLQVLYSAPLEREQWQRFLSCLCEFTGSRLGVFIAADTCSGLAVVAAAGGSEELAAVTLYNQQYARTDPFRPAMIRRAVMGTLSSMPGANDPNAVVNARCRQCARQS